MDNQPCAKDNQRNRITLSAIHHAFFDLEQSRLRYKGPKRLHTTLKTAYARPRRKVVSGRYLSIQLQHLQYRERKLIPKQNLADL